ncbi:MAG TPA: elongation factor P [Anaerolineae bacterium]|nr:elongation factor P [Anaerolineae bacterium]
MIDVNALRKGTTFELDGEIYRVLEYAHNKPGRGNATIRTKVRNLRTGSTFEKTFGSGDRVQDIRIESRAMQYLYHDGDLYHFMDTDTFEQIALDAKLLEEAIPFLKDGMSVVIQDYQGESLGIDLPVTVDLKITQSDAGVRGDTATGANKYVTVETGHRVQVPLFVNEGDTIRVDTRTGEYLTRV